MTKRTQLKSLPVRVQFTLNPILHRDAIVLLQNLSKNELAETVAGLLQWGALVQNGMAHGRLGLNVSVDGSVGPTARPVRKSTQASPANGQANDRSPIEPMSRPTPTRPDEIYSS